MFDEVFKNLKSDDYLQRIRALTPTFKKSVIRNYKAFEIYATYWSRVFVSFSIHAEEMVRYINYLDELGEKNQNQMYQLERIWNRIIQTNWLKEEIRTFFDTYAVSDMWLQDTQIYLRHVGLLQGIVWSGHMSVPNYQNSNSISLLHQYLLGYYETYKNNKMQYEMVYQMVRENDV